MADAETRSDYPTIMSRPGPSEDSGESSSPLDGPSDAAQPSSSADSASAEEFRLRILADAPLATDASDRFGYGDIADGLTRLIEDAETATPLTIAISAPWGAGKTSLLRLVEDRVVRQRAAPGQAPAIVVWFDAWMHDAAPNLSAALAADVARHATRCRSLWLRLWHPLPSAMLSPKERARRRFWLGVVALISSVAIYPLLYWLISPPPADVTKVRAAFGAWAVGWFALVWGISALWPRVRRSVAAMAAFVDDPRSAAATGSMTEVSAQLGKLIAEAQDKVRRDWDSTQRPRFVVVVDDLERCQPPKAVDVCEVAAQLLNHRDVITILVGDLRVIAASAELKYRDAVDQFGKGSDFAADGFGRFFLQKVVQFELELPPIPPERLRQLARSPGAGSDRADYRMPKPVNRPLGATGKLWVVIFFICIGILKLIGANSVGLSALIATLAIAFGVTIIRFARRPRSRKLRILRDKVAEAINIVLTEVIASVDPSVTSEDIEAEAMKRLAEVEGAYKEEKYWKDAKDLVSAEKVRPRLQLSAVADEKTRADAVGAILDLLPPIPRTTKRLLNRLYFLLVVAYNRNLITLKKVSPEQLGKWAVLLDRWPEAARAINKNPQLVQVLEDKAEQQDDFTTLCSEYTPPLASDLGPLRDFFQANPKLAPAAYNLVYLDADVKPPAPSSALTTEPEASPEATETPADTAVPAAAPNGRREKNPMTR